MVAKLGAVLVLVSAYKITVLGSAAVILDMNLQSLLEWQNDYDNDDYYLLILSLQDLNNRVLYKSTFQNQEIRTSGCDVLLFICYFYWHNSKLCNGAKNETWLFLRKVIAKMQMMPLYRDTNFFRLFRL